jgi:hypothetical protein
MTALAAVFVAMSAIGAGARDRGDGPGVGEASSQYSCGAGRIRDVESVTEVVIVRPAWRRPGESAATTAPGPVTAEHAHDHFVVTVRFNGAYYTIRAAADASWNLNPMTFRFDESIDVCVNAAEMVLDRLDGTDFRGLVIRVQTDEPPAVPRGR